MLYNKENLHADDTNAMVLLSNQPNMDVDFSLPLVVLEILELPNEQDADKERTVSSSHQLVESGQDNTRSHRSKGQSFEEIFNLPISQVHPKKSINVVQ